MDQPEQEKQIPLHVVLFFGVWGTYFGGSELLLAVRTGKITWVSRTGPQPLITYAKHPIGFDFMVAMAVCSLLTGLVIIFAFCRRTLKRWGF